MTNKRCRRCLFVGLVHDNDKLVYVCLSWDFLLFALWNRETMMQPWQHKGDRVGRDFFFDIYIYIFRKKKNEKGLLLMLKRRRRLLLLLSFFECITTMPRFFLASTLPFSHSPSIDPTSFAFLFFSFFFLSFFSSSSPSLFLSTLFPLSPYSRSPWVMSNLCVLYI